MSQEFYPRKVFYYSCLGFFINQIFNSDVHKNSDILHIILYSKMAPEHVFRTRTEQNTSAIIVCLVHPEQYLFSETKYLYAGDGRF